MSLEIESKKFLKLTVNHEDLFTWHIRNDVAVLEVVLDDLTEEEYIAGLHLLGYYAQNMPKGTFKKRVVLVKMDKLRFNRNMIRETVMHAKTKVYYDEQLAYGKLNKMMLVFMKVVSTVLPKKMKFFTTREEAYNYISNS